MEDSLSRSMFRLQAVGDNKSPSLEDSDDGLRHKNSISRSCPGAPEQPGQDASRSRWSGTRATGGTGGYRGVPRGYVPTYLRTSATYELQPTVRTRLQDKHLPSQPLEPLMKRCRFVWTRYICCSILYYLKLSLTWSLAQDSVDD